MSRLIFFIQEAFRALRRNGAPSMAAIVTTVVTVILLGVLIPIFQTTQAKSDQVRGELNLQVALYQDATQAEIADAAKEARRRSRTSPRSNHQQVRGPEGTEADARHEEERRTDVAAAHNPLPANFKVKADDAANLAAVRAAIIADRARTASRSRSRRSSATPSTASRTRRRSSR